MYDREAREGMLAFVASNQHAARKSTAASTHALHTVYFGDRSRNRVYALDLDVPPLWQAGPHFALTHMPDVCGVCELWFSSI